MLYALHVSFSCLCAVHPFEVWCPQREVTTKNKNKTCDRIFINNVFCETRGWILSSSWFKILNRVSYNNEHNSCFYLKHSIQMCKFKTDCSCVASLFPSPSPADLAPILSEPAVGKRRRLSRGLTAVQLSVTRISRTADTTHEWERMREVEPNWEHCFLIPTNFRRSIFFQRGWNLLIYFPIDLCATASVV
jgi:hypothetical protein